ncbi:MAG: hypothetical protein ABSF16_17325 [Terracidiphilus sp.]|jgi:DNA polymerase III delta prime subunit
MKVRELLQIELWSKEISRKILRRTWKILVRIGIVSGVIVLVLGIILVVELRWMTSGERKAATVALVEIDGLQNIDSLSEDDANAGLKRANEKLGLASQASWTIRDKSVVLSLSMYLWEIEHKREDKKFIDNAIRNNPSWWNSHPDSLARLKKLERSESIFRAELHKELN